MINFKEEVKNNFNNASHTYDKVANIQRKSAKILTKFLCLTVNRFYPKSILDIGSGTGYVTLNLLKRFPRSEYTLNDISENMINIIKHKLKNNTIKAKFILGDMETIPFIKHDLYISNFAIQWVNNLNYIIKEFYNSSKVLAFSCLLDGTFSEVNKELLLNKINNYPTEQEVTKFILSLNPKQYGIFSQEFSFKSNIQDFFKYLKNLGAQGKASSIQLSLNHLKKVICNNNIINIVYNVLFVVLVRE